jgi:uncharacterized protein
VKLLFADSSYFIALSMRHDAFHAAALQFSRRNDRPLVVTDAIILELGAHFARADRRPAFERIMKTLAEDQVEIIHHDPGLLRQALDLFFQRPDKDWSLADCISFLVMKDRDLVEAITTDEHFEQAGFIALLRQPANS